MPNTTPNQPENDGQNAFITAMGRDVESETDVGEIENQIISAVQSIDQPTIVAALRKAGLNRDAELIELLHSLSNAHDYAVSNT